MALAHWVRPEQVIAELESPALRETFGITEVARHDSLPRLLVIRTGPRWAGVDPSRRRRAAEQWLRRWQHAVPQGIVAVIDAATEHALVNFDTQGRALLKDAPVGLPADRGP